MARSLWPVVAVASALVMAAPAAAVQLPPTTDPLPGSTFQGADGNQANDPGRGLIDWQALEAADRVVHSPDPNAQDSAFTGGSKENQPGEWDLTTEADGVNPAKANIRDAWSSVDQRNGDTFLYLAFSREASNGTTFLTFELNHDDRLWDNGRAEIPCRRTGDVQISYEAQGNDVEVVIRRWTTTTSDPDRGCARRGDFEDFARLTPNVDAQGAVNSASITNYLPGAHGGTIPTERFGEASLNLEALLNAAFGETCMGFASVWMHSRSSTSESSNLQDYVAPRSLAVRTCSASGTKFFDSNANGVRDPGERGIPRFLIWADYNDDGIRQQVEPFAVSDDEGHYVIYDIRPPDGTYTLRERLVPRLRTTPPVASDWICSFPNAFTQGGTGSAPGGRFGCGWGPIDPAATPNATGRDFGNWFPARLTVEKVIEPATDPGRFDLLVDGTVVLPQAGNESSVTVNLPPGTYTVSEVAAAGTNGADYTSTVECRRNPTRAGARRTGLVFEDIPLSAGDEASCTFRNLRLGPPPVPAIAIRKTGPSIATAGDTLQYRLRVTNPGSVPFPAATVSVSDPVCDAPPALVSKQGDGSPQTLDPGDTWIYRCSNATPAGGAACEPTRVENTGVVTGTAGGTTVDDEDSISTILLCPPRPVPPVPPVAPEPVVPLGPEPGPVAPPGPRPPNAGDAAAAGALFRQATRGCISSRVPRVDFRGTRIAGVRIAVNGVLIRELTMDVLQRRVRPRVTLEPGRYRVTARVRFQNGSGTPPVTLARLVRICGRPAAQCSSCGGPTRARVFAAPVRQRRTRAS